VIARPCLASFALLCACSAPPPAHPSYAGYPAHWWEPVEDEDVPEWEILPQAAGPGEVILSKRHELGLLSNFADTPFVYRGQRYASLEGFWQCMKYPEGPDDPRAKLTGWEHTRAEVRELVAFEAHAAGVAAEAILDRAGIDWVSFEGEEIRYKGRDVERHYALIVDATRCKVDQNPEVKEVLLATGDLALRPDHQQEADRTKAWGYHRIYMLLRDELEAGTFHAPPRPPD